MSVSNLFWDSNVFIAFLNDEKDIYDIPSIKQYLEDAKLGKCKIYTSSIAFSEVTPKRLVRSEHGTFNDFLADFRSQIITVGNDPNIGALSAELKDLPYKKNNSTKRILTTGDAIMLATALELELTYKVKLDAFHTFDNGKGPRSPEGGKAIPMLTYEEWCEGIESDPLASRVIQLNRCTPVHPSPTMFNNAS